MKKEYWFILITYIVMQLSSLVGIPLMSIIGEIMGKTPKEAQTFAVPFWLIISFSVTLLIVLFLLRKEFKRDPMRDVLPRDASTIWAFAGIFLAFFAQVLAGYIERLLGIEVGSENTQQIVKIITQFPLVILISSIVGPILEEIVFRKIIFGSLHKRMNFFLAALISSVIFALAHMEPEHILLYASMGFVFAFLYVKTKRILVPIFAHVTMNTFVVLIQSVFREDIERMVREAEKIQSIIGGFHL